jgi:hydrogenase nickel incorporation protein HypA/HybF
MHELSIAYNLIETAERAAKNAGAAQVVSVQLELGALSGVVKDALLFSYDIAVKGTLLEGSRLEVIDVPLVLYCAVCEREMQITDIQNFRCPQCGTPSRDIHRGRELRVASIEIEEGALNADATH